MTTDILARIESDTEAAVGRAFVTLVTEYFARTFESNGDSWLILTSVVEDPQYLTGRFVRSTHYKRLPDTNTTWQPEACSAK